MFTASVHKCFGKLFSWIMVLAISCKDLFFLSTTPFCYGVLGEWYHGGFHIFHKSFQKVHFQILLHDHSLLLNFFYPFFHLYLYAEDTKHIIWFTLGSKEFNLSPSTKVINYDKSIFLPIDLCNTNMTKQINVKQF